MWKLIIEFLGHKIYTTVNVAMVSKGNTLAAALFVVRTA